MDPVADGKRSRIEYTVTDAPMQLAELHRGIFARVGQYAFTGDASGLFDLLYDRRRSGQT